MDCKNLPTCNMQKSILGRKVVKRSQNALHAISVSAEVSEFIVELFQSEIILSLEVDH